MLCADQSLCFFVFSFCVFAVANIAVLFNKLHCCCYCCCTSAAGQLNWFVPGKYSTAAVATGQSESKNKKRKRKKRPHQITIPVKYGGVCDGVCGGLAVLGGPVTAATKWNFAFCCCRRWIIFLIICHENVFAASPLFSCLCCFQFVRQIHSARTHTLTLTCV